MAKLTASEKEKCINTLRFVSADAVEKANSGHPGMPMGDAAMAFTLWSEHLNFNPKETNWHGRDRFVLSAGHGSMLLYSLLHLSGYDISLDDLKNFRQWESPTPGHPEYDLKRGVETTTGPLGQGFATGVGMALAQKYLSMRFDKPDYPLFDYNIFAITSDGDLMEGISSEAASTAGHLGLGSIVYLYSANKITIEGSTDLAFTEDVEKRFKAFNWHVLKVDGNDTEAVSKAIRKSKKVTDKPSLIIARTHIGFGSPNKQDTSGVHGSPLGADELKASKEKMGWPVEPSFHIPDEVRDIFESCAKKGKRHFNKWSKLFKAYCVMHEKEGEELKRYFDGNVTELPEDLPSFDPKDGGVATRSASGKFLNAVAKHLPFMLGGSADLAPSNNTSLNDLGNLQKETLGQNIHYGIREHAMGAI
ncbi:MAG: transketolase, partial [Deltaproteobacteria bacterium]|nr:transketolase [Deltaproteobacteria bacterium]